MVTKIEYNAILRDIHFKDKALHKKNQIIRSLRKELAELRAKDQAMRDMRMAQGGQNLYPAWVVEPAAMDEPFKFLEIERDDEGNWYMGARVM